MITFCENLLQQSLSFLTEKQGASGRKGESGQGSALHARCQAGEAVTFQQLQCVPVIWQVQCRHAKTRTHGCSDHLGVELTATAFQQNDDAGAECLAGTHDCAKVAGVLNAVEHDRHFCLFKYGNRISHLWRFEVSDNIARSMNCRQLF